MEKIHISKKNKNLISLIGLNFLIFGLLLFLVVLPENNKIKLETERLYEIENIVIDDLRIENYESATIYLIQLRWMYNPSSAKGISETDSLKLFWDTKRNEYNKLIDKK